MSVVAGTGHAGHCRLAVPCAHSHRLLSAPCLKTQMILFAPSVQTALHSVVPFIVDMALSCAPGQCTFPIWAPSPKGRQVVCVNDVLDAGCLPGVCCLKWLGQCASAPQGLAIEVFLTAWLATVQGRWLGVGHVWRSLCGEGCLVAAACTGGWYQSFSDQVCMFNQTGSAVAPHWCCNLVQMQASACADIRECDTCQD